MPLPEAFHYYCSGIRKIECLSYEEKKLIQQRFKEKLLGIDGLPVIIINLSRNSHATSFVMLMESDKTKEAFISGVNDIVNECISECCKGSELKLLSPYFENSKNQYPL